jgi:hypothetical protein
MSYVLLIYKTWDVRTLKTNLMLIYHFLTFAWFGQVLYLSKRVTEKKLIKRPQVHSPAKGQENAQPFLGSSKANGREPKSCLGCIFNFKLGCFTKCV